MVDAKVGKNAQTSDAKLQNSVAKLQKAAFGAFFQPKRHSSFQYFSYLCIRQITYPKIRYAFRNTDDITIHRMLRHHCDADAQLASTAQQRCGLVNGMGGSHDTALCLSYRLLPTCHMAAGGERCRLYGL